MVQLPTERAISRSEWSKRITKESYCELFAIPLDADMVASIRTNVRRTRARLPPASHHAIGSVPPVESRCRSDLLVPSGVPDDTALHPRMQPTSRLIPVTAILAGALALSALFVAVGLTRVRPDVHSVSVKGVAEREVRADLAIWPLNISAADDDLSRAQAKLEQSVTAIRAFLVRHQVDTSQISLQSFVVSDAFANQFGGTGEVRTRYVIRQTVVVRSADPQRVLAASQRVGELVSGGIVLTSGGEYGAGGPTFVFTGLNALKPPMIAEATARAREAAEQFARDARQELGGIRRASQGVFEILPRDQAPGITEGTQLLKTVRVVSTIEFALRD
jgi:hypothetical protein